MKQVDLQLLKNIYDHYLSTNDRVCTFSFIKSSPQEKQTIYNSLDYLAECGYIRYLNSTLGFCDIQITVSGIAFAENDFKKPNSLPTIQGDNNIYVNGSSNSISENHNRISLDIKNSDLPDDCKQLIDSFLYEMKNPHISQEKKSEKIKTFLSDISSGTISGIAASGLTALLVSLFNQIPF